MKIEIRIEPPRLLAGRGKRRWAVAVALAMALAVAVPVAWASDLFGDVPNSNPFHDDIGAIAKAGVTKGCSATTPPNYCPGDNVTREAMAAFMHRGFGRVGAEVGNNAPVTGTGPPTVLVTQQITVGLPSGALAGATGFILGTGTVSLKMTDTTGCPCTYRVFLTLDGTGQFSQSGYVTFPSGSDNALVSAATTGVAAVTTSGVHTVEVRVQRVGTVVIGDAIGYGNLTALYVPFGSTGTNTP
jgi:hypothetical protein